MDIYSLINSKAISNHCRAIAHQFNSLEMAYLVYANDTLNIRQKHNVFEEIIREYPDMEVQERPWTPRFDSLHDFLRLYMEVQNKYIAMFFRDEPNCIYSFRVQYLGDESAVEDRRLFSMYTECYKVLKSEIDELVTDYRQCGVEIAPVDIKVTKTWIKGEEENHLSQIVLYIDSDGNPLDIDNDSEEDSDILQAFDGLWLEIPTPFQRGDILIASTNWIYNRPFVLDSIPYWEEDGKNEKTVMNLRTSGDCSDLITSIYGQDDDGTVWNDHGPSYLTLEYYERKLCGTERFLIALSNYLKGELPLELLLRAYDITKNEHRAEKDRELISSFYGDLLKKAGLLEK